MNIIDFLNQNKIKWEPINIKFGFKKDGKPDKSPAYVGSNSKYGYMPKTSDFNPKNNDPDNIRIKPKELKRRQELLQITDYIGIDTFVIQQIDIDEIAITEEKKNEIINNNPYFLSVKKQLPHVFVMLQDKQNYNNKIYIDKEKNELLNGQWGWAHKDTIIFNAENVINIYSPVNIKMPPHCDISQQLCNIEPMITTVENKIIDKVEDGPTFKFPPIITNEVKPIAKIDNIPTLLTMLNDNRLKYNDWVKIGMIIKNSNGDIKDWVQWSRRSIHFDERECYEKWNTFNHNTKLTLGTLKAFAKEDSPEDYHFHYKVITRKCLTDYDVATVIHKFLRKKYVCIVNAKDKGMWYHFRNHRWYNCGGSQFSIDISTIIYDEYMRVYKEILKEIDTTSNEEIKKEISKEAVAFLKVAKSLKSNSSKSNFQTQAQTLFAKTEDEFFLKLNENPWLIGFENGIFDLKNNVFRDGKPDDFVTFTTGYNYDPAVNLVKRQEILNIIYSIFENQDDATAFLHSIAHTICGIRNKEKFTIWIGRGGNGKGFIKKIISLVFGNYFREIDSNQITDPTNCKSKANSELAQLRGVRNVITSEPDENEAIQSNKIKLFTGNDEVTARQLYGESFTFKPQFYLTLQTNGKCELSKFDGGMIRRIMMIDFPFNFVPEPKLSFERKINENLKTIVEEDIDFKNQFMLLLLETFNATRGNFEPSPNMLDITKEYLAEQNDVLDFINNIYIATNNEKDKVKTLDMLNEYKEFTQNKIMTSKKFVEQLKINNIPYKKCHGIMKVIGYKLKCNACFIVDDDEL